MDEAAARDNENRLNDLVEKTSSLSKELKGRIQTLQKKSGSGRDGQIHKQQVCASFDYRGLPQNNLTILCRTDRFSQTKVCRGHPELPTSGASVSLKV